MGQNPQLFPAKSRAVGGRRADLGGRYFRSSWEANYARYLNWLHGLGEIQGWEYESESFTFPVKRGSIVYTPDFKVTEKNGSVVFHEIKGYMDQRSATKLRRMAKYYPKIRVIVIEKNAYKAIAVKVAHMLPWWEGGKYGRARAQLPAVVV